MIASGSPMTSEAGSDKGQDMPEAGINEWHFKWLTRILQRDSMSFLPAAPLPMRIKVSGYASPATSANAGIGDNRVCFTGSGSDTLLGDYCQVVAAFTIGACAQRESDL